LQSQRILDFATEVDAGGMGRALFNVVAVGDCGRIGRWLRPTMDSLIAARSLMLHPAASSIAPINTAATTSVDDRSSDAWWSWALASCASQARPKLSQPSAADQVS